MKIAVLGAGAIGGLVWGYLRRAGEEAVLVAKPSLAARLRQEGLDIKGVRGDFKVKGEVVDALRDDYDVVVLAVKTQDLREALEKAAKYLPGAYIILVQNGLAAEKIAASFVDPERIIPTIVMFGATYTSLLKVVHNFEGKWIWGLPGGQAGRPAAEKIAAVFKKAFSVEISSSLPGQKWLKLFINASNCLPAILGKSVQEVFADRQVCQISLGIWKEGLGLMKKAGLELADIPGFPQKRIRDLVSLPPEEGAEVFSRIMTGLSRQPLYGSVLQSLKRGRPTEIDYINGAFVALGAEVGFHVPLNKKLVELVHRVEKEKKFLEREELVRQALPLIPRAVFSGEEVNTPFPALKLTVLEVSGDCYHGYRKGEEIILDDFTHPPRHFCLGLAHSLFPVIYGLSFGAHFPFSPNQRSLEVTCPDGGRLKFKAEVLDRQGKVEYVPRDKNYQGPQPKELTIEVVKSDGTCSYGYKKGDKFKVEGLKTPAGFCGAAYHTLFPALFALNFGAKFFFMDSDDSIDTVTCPDGGKIVFKVSRQEWKKDA